MNIQTNESQTVLSSVIKRAIDSQSQSLFQPVKQSETLHLQNAYLIGEEEYITSTPLLTKMIQQYGFSVDHCSLSNKEIKIICSAEKIVPQAQTPKDQVALKQE